MSATLSKNSLLPTAAKDAFNFLKTVTSLRHDEKEIKVNAPDNQGIVVITSPGSPPLTINQTILKIADKSEEQYKRISNEIEEDRIDKISAMDKRQEGILITSKEKKLFNPETRVEDKPTDLIGNIFDFNWNHGTFFTRLRNPLIHHSSTSPTNQYFGCLLPPRMPPIFLERLWIVLLRKVKTEVEKKQKRRKEIATKWSRLRHCFGKAIRLSAPKFQSPFN